MKKSAAAVASAVALVSISLATTATAGLQGENPDYGGKIEGKKSQYFGFDRAEGQVGNFETVNLVVECKNPKGKLYGSGPLGDVGPYKIKDNGTFKGKDTIDTTPTPRGETPSKIEIAIKGEVDGNKAKGTLEVNTSGGRKCKSGEVSWKAKRPSPDRPDPKPQPVRLG